jgi:hypothetical protein
MRIVKRVRASLVLGLGLWVLLGNPSTAALRWPALPSQPVELLHAAAPVPGSSSARGESVEPARGELMEAADYVAVILETTSGRYWVICRNDPVNNVDPLGLETYEIENARLLGLFDVPSGYAPYFRGTTEIEDLGAQIANVGTLLVNVFWNTLSGVNTVTAAIDESPKAIGFNESISEMQAPLGPAAFATGGGELKTMLVLSSFARCARIEVTLGEGAALQRTLVRAEEATGSAAKRGTSRFGEFVAGWRPLRVADVPLPSEARKTFTGNKAVGSVLASDTVFYRVSGGRAGRVGGYLTRTKPNGVQEAVQTLALNPDWELEGVHLIEVRVPKGTVIWEGTAKRQGSLPGGGSQVWVSQEQLSENWFRFIDW